MQVQGNGETAAPGRVARRGTVAMAVISEKRVCCGVERVNRHFAAAGFCVSSLGQVLI
jgi:hypothetical protein